MSTYEVEDNSINGVGPILQLLQHFFPYAQKQLGFHKPVMISFQSDEENSNKLLGRTGHYNPDDFSIGIYVDGRHPKDVLRSLSHELIHHTQNCNGEFDAMENLGPGYAQDNPAMRDAELDAYKRGNIIFRDFEDLIKKGEIVCDIDFEELGEPRMSLKEWKNNELNMLMMKKWGLLKEGASISKAGRIDRTDIANKVPPEWIKEGGMPRYRDDEEELDEADTGGKEEEGAAAAKEFVDAAMGTSSTQTKSKPTEAEILARGGPFQTGTPEQSAESYGRGEGRAAGKRRIRGGQKAEKAPLVQGENGTADDSGVSYSSGGNRREDLYEDEEVDEGMVGDALTWAKEKFLGTSKPSGPAAIGKQAASQQQSKLDKAAAIADADNRVEDSLYEGEEELEELTRWHELAGLEEQDTVDFDEPPDTTPTPTPTPTPTAPMTTPPSPGGAGTLVARHDDGKKRKNKQESITLDEARDLARRIFEKLTEETEEELSEADDDASSKLKTAADAAFGNFDAAAATDTTKKETK